MPELPNIQTWAQMRKLLIAKFGGEFSLKVKKDAFGHIAFVPRETLVIFENKLYVKGQQLMISCQIIIAKAFSTCSAALKINPTAEGTKPPPKTEAEGKAVLA